MNVNYTTFWNDFSHYSLSEDSVQSGLESIDIAKEDMLFSDKSKFIELPNLCVNFHEHRCDKYMTETFLHDS